jgi:thiol-disulfide isomerase/thioredoxin
VAAAVVAIAVGAVIFAANSSVKVPPAHLSKYGEAPALDATGWINSPPLTPAKLSGKVVLYDFWTYSCINCQRTIPYLRSWFDRYRADGLVIVGVHTPEFDFEKVHKNVEAAAKRLDVTWPIALDDHERIWNAFENFSWPADYFADRTGEIRYKHVGEGDYTDAENTIRKLLGVPATAPRASAVTHGDSASGAAINPETYLGTLRNTEQQWRTIHAGIYDYSASGTGALTFPGVALVGRWTGTSEYIRSEATAASILLRLHAREVTLVMATANGKPVDAVVELDGQPIPVADRGASVHDDGNGRTVVTIHASDMYRIVRSAAVGDHVLSIAAPGPGLEAYAFTFG